MRLTFERVPPSEEFHGQLICSHQPSRRFPHLGEHMIYPHRPVKALGNVMKETKECGVLLRSALRSRKQKNIEGIVQRLKYT